MDELRITLGSIFITRLTLGNFTEVITRSSWKFHLIISGIQVVVPLMTSYCSTLYAKHIASQSTKVEILNDQNELSEVELTFLMVRKLLKCDSRTKILIL
jgi:hypothetical protein